MNKTGLSDRIKQAIQSKTGGVISQELAWRLAAEKAVEVGLMEADVVNLIESWSSVRYLEILARLAGRREESLAGFGKLLRQRVDETDFGIEDWMEALEVMMRYLIQTNREAKPSVILGYIHCAAELVQSKHSMQRLPEAVEDMLGLYGFEG